MIWYGPAIYPQFRCIAGDCQHSCCIGWEIDIDSETENTYRSVGGEFGKTLCGHMKWEDGVTSFALTQDERCPFLNSRGLCDIYTTLGEDALCQICRDHPRFRNYFSSRGEIGLGLCCEAAASLILGCQEPMTFVPLFDDGEICIASDEWEAYLIHERDKIIELCQLRGLPLHTREDMICAQVGAKVPDFSLAEWMDILLSLERMDTAWDELLLSCKEVEAVTQPQNEIPYEQFLVYLLFRHVSGGEDQQDLQARAAFCVLCSRLLRAIVYANPTVSMVECARLFSAEVEYSQENTERLLMMLEDMQTEGCL